jgi:hypothetical protein
MKHLECTVQHLEHLVASFGGCVPLRSDTITRLGQTEYMPVYMYYV